MNFHASRSVSLKCILPKMSQKNECTRKKLMNNFINVEYYRISPRSQLPFTCHSYQQSGRKPPSESKLQGFRCITVCGVTPDRLMICIAVVRGKKRHAPQSDCAMSPPRLAGERNSIIKLCTLQSTHVLVIASELGFIDSDSEAQD